MENGFGKVVLAEAGNLAMVNNEGIISNNGLKVNWNPLHDNSIKWLLTAGKDVLERDS